MPVRIGVSYVHPKSGPKYVEALREAGSEPIELATPESCPRWPTASEARRLFSPTNEAVRRLDELDGLLLTGGGDIDPMLYQEAMDGSEEPDWPRDHLEMAQLTVARRRGLPILGICRGIQFLNVAMGGGLVQHLASTQHHQGSVGDPRAHLVRVAADSALARIFAGEPTEDLIVGVNSYHHQGVDQAKLAPGLVVTGQSLVPADEVIGLIEAVETPATRAGQEFILGVQWHPERKGDATPRGPNQPVDYRALSNRLFRAFVEAAENHAREK